MNPDPCRALLQVEGQAAVARVLDRLRPAGCDLVRHPIHNQPRTVRGALRPAVRTPAGLNFPLNVGRTPEGDISGSSVERLEPMGRSLDTAGEAICATKAGPIEKPLAWGRAPQNPSRPCLHVFDWPRDGKLPVPLVNRPSKALLLMHPGEPLSCRANAAGLETTLPSRDPRCDRQRRGIRAGRSRPGGSCPVKSRPA